MEKLAAAINSGDVLDPGLISEVNLSNPENADDVVKLVVPRFFELLVEPEMRSQCCSYAALLARIEPSLLETDQFMKHRTDLWRLYADIVDRATLISAMPLLQSLVSKEKGFFAGFLLQYFEHMTTRNGRQVLLKLADVCTEVCRTVYMPQHSS